MIPSAIFEQIPERSVEGLVLARADRDDGAVMYVQWCNRAYSKITGFLPDDIVGRRGSVLVGPDLEPRNHLLIIEKLMNWEHFSLYSHNTRKSGEVYFQKMTWVPLHDPDSGDRWWVYSCIEVDERAHANLIEHALDARVAPDAAAAARIAYLERENRRLHQLAQTVAEQSHQDPLSGLSNRRHFEVELQSWAERLRAGGADFAVLYIDLDRFKMVNDTLGHDAGDKLIAQVAERLRAITSEEDLVARIGGDEFVVLTPMGESALNISGLADAIVAGLKTPFSYEGKTVSCSASVGVAIASDGADDPKHVVGHADAALYHAKAQGKARWSFFTEAMHARSVEIKRLASDLLVACDTGQFTPFFQPLVNAATGRISSAEVLVRWDHPTRGLLLPQAFLEVATQMGIAKRIDAIVFGHLRAALAFFDSEGVDLPRVAVNVSAGRLADPSFVHDIKASGIAPERLAVEILESVYLERMNDIVRWALDELDDLGVTVAIDDFGTGHASVQGLLQVKPALLKIDRQFVQPIVADETARELVSSIIGIGKSLGMEIVAEGVESEAHARIVRDMGCDHLQGFFFGRPMTAADLCARLRETDGQFWPGLGAVVTRAGGTG
ncbi:EAL domain-containing protein [Roseobacteraceae bacterium S113]